VRCESQYDREQIVVVEKNPLFKSLLLLVLLLVLVLLLLLLVFSFLSFSL